MDMNKEKVMENQSGSWGMMTLRAADELSQRHIIEREGRDKGDAKNARMTITHFTKGSP